MKSIAKQRFKRFTSMFAAILMIFTLFATLPVEAQAADLTAPTWFDGEIDESTTPASVVLYWNAGGKGNGYVIHRSEGGGPFTELAATNNTRFKAYTDTTAKPGTSYGYKIAMYKNENGQRVMGDFAATIVRITTPGNTPLPASLATPFITSATSTDSGVVLIWNPVPGADEYIIYRSESMAGPFDTVVGTTSGTTYTDTSTLAPNTTYYYTVKATAVGGDESAHSDPASVRTREEFEAPELVEVEARAGSPNSVYVRWLEVPNADEYVLARSVNGGGFDVIDYLPAGQLDYVDTDDIQEGVQYCYKVLALIGENATPYSNTLCDTLVIDRSILLSVTGIAENNVDLGIVPTNIAGTGDYTVYRSLTQNSGYTQIDTAPANATSYADGGVQPNTTYWYYVTRVDATTGQPIESNRVSATTPEETVRTITLSATAQGYNRIELGIVPANITGSGDYTVYRSLTQNSGYTQIDTAPANASNYPDDTVQPNTTYWYYVTRVDATTGQTIESNRVSARTEEAPPVTDPRVFIAAFNNVTDPQTQVDLSYSSLDVNGTADFTLYRSTSEFGTYTQVASRGYNTVQHTDTGLAPGTTYWYYAERHDATTGNLIESVRVPITTAEEEPNPAIDLSGVPNGTTGANLSYTPTDITGTYDYQIYRSSTSATSGFAPIGTRGYNETTYPDTGLSAGTTYWYYVTRVDATTGRTIQSNTVEIKTDDPATNPSITLSGVPNGTTGANLSYTPTDITGTYSYQIYRSSTDATSGFAQIGTRGYNETTYPDTGLSAGTTYWYYVTRVDATTGRTIQSNTVEIRTDENPTTNPAIQLGGRLQNKNQAYLTYASVDIAGTNNYLVYRSTTGQPNSFTQIVTRGYNTFDHTDNGLAANTTYWYYVTRVDTTTGRTIQSNTVEIRTENENIPDPPPEITGPGAPNFWLTPTGGDCPVNWRYAPGWSNPPNPRPQPSYIIYLSGSPNGPWEQIEVITGSTAKSGHLYITLGATYNHKYPYNLAKYMSGSGIVYFKMAAKDSSGRIGPMSTDTRWWNVANYNAPHLQNNNLGYDTGWYPTN